MRARGTAQATGAFVEYVVLRGGDSIGAVPVGLDPVSVRARSNTEAWVVNHVSDSVSIVDLQAMNVNLVKGDPYGGACTLDQFFVWRPYASQINNGTPQSEAQPQPPEPWSAGAAASISIPLGLPVNTPTKR